MDKYDMIEQAERQFAREVTLGVIVTSQLRPWYYIIPGYFIIDKLSIGAMIMLEVWKRGEETGTNAAIGPRINYYLSNPTGPGYIYFHAGALFGVYEHVSNWDNPFDNDNRFQFGPGYAIPLNENISITSLLYYSYDISDPVGPNNRANGSRIGMRLGFKFFHFF